MDRAEQQVYTFKFLQQYSGDLSLVVEQAQFSIRAQQQIYADDLFVPRAFFPTAESVAELKRLVGEIGSIGECRIFERTFKYAGGKSFHAEFGVYRHCLSGTLDYKLKLRLK